MVTLWIIRRITTGNQMLLLSAESDTDVRPTAQPLCTACGSSKAYGFVREVGYRTQRLVWGFTIIHATIEKLCLDLKCIVFCASYTMSSGLSESSSSLTCLYLVCRQHESLSDSCVNRFSSVRKKFLHSKHVKGLNIV
jgi:hypothetical protein